jgi:hypothetical protein
MKANKPFSPSGKDGIMRPTIISRTFYILATVLCAWHCRSPRAATGSLPSIVIEPRSAWQAAEPRPYKSHIPVRLTIHHEGTMLEPTSDGAAKIHAIQKWGMGPDRKWADIPYHFLIAPNGRIYEGRNVMTAGETATEYDPAGHLLITCLGNLEVQELPAAQLASLVSLTAWCSRKYGIPLSTLSSHRDHSSQTTCPGKNLYAYLQNGYIRTQADSILASMH